MERRLAKDGSIAKFTSPAEGNGHGGGTAASGGDSRNKKGKKADDPCQIDSIIGDFGSYQLLIFTFKILIGVTSAFNNLGVTFFAPSDFISYTCLDQYAVNATTIVSQNQTNPLEYMLETQYLQNHTATTAYSSPSPRRTHQSLSRLLSDFLSGEERRHKHELELDYDTPTNLKRECSYLSPVDDQMHKCTAFQYDTGIWISTIIDEWDLVCDRAWFISMTQSLYMSGFILSFVLFGYISDRFGRWNSLMIGALIEALSGLGCALANSVTTFMIFRFLIGIGNAGRTSSSYLVMIEWTGPRWRMFISTLGSLGWAVGYSLMPWITRYFLHFRHMQLFACFYEIIFIIWLLRIPESPRWLLTHRRFEKAREVLLMAAKFNGLILSDSKEKKLGGQVDLPACCGTSASNSINGSTILYEENGNNEKKIIDVEAGDDAYVGASEDQPLMPYTMEEFEIKFKTLTKTVSAKEFTKNEDKLNLFDLFKWKNLRKYALILAFAWACNSFIYYGIALRVGDFGGRNLFVAFSIAGLTELPSIAFTMLLMKFLPRRATNLFMFALVGILCAIQAPLKYYDIQWLQQSTIMLAKLFNSCSFTVILYQTMELFPTSIRQTAYSSCALAGRIGSILAPFIKELSQMTNSTVPPIIYALLSLLSALLIKELPETQGSDLPDTLLEAEKFKGTEALVKLQLPTPALMKTKGSFLVRRKQSNARMDPASNGS